MSSRNKQIILIALSVLLVVLFLFMPEQPLEVRNKMTDDSKALTAKEHEPGSKEEPTSSAMDERVKTAVAGVQSENPMAGIQDLLAIVREDSTQVDAQYYLGLFSIKTSQFEKAVNRFEKVITFAGLKKYPDTRFQLSVCLEELGNKTEALNQLELYLSEIDPADSEKKAAVSAEIERLKN